MAQILDFMEASDGAKVQFRGLWLEEQETEFWPGVASRQVLKRPRDVNPANSLKRVLFEILLTLGGAGVLAAMVSSFLR